MSGGSSSAAAWPTQLEPVLLAENLARRPDDPRLGEFLEPWRGDLAALSPGRAVVIGFPQDEGVRRNGGRPGAAAAPREIRRWLARLTAWDAARDIDLTRPPPLDLGDLRPASNLEAAQEALGAVIGAVLRSGAVPVVLGGGHETAYGHYLGYVNAGLTVGVINLDAHLDVRPFIEGKGHSGSPFRQALEHPTRPLPGSSYTCLGAQPHAVSRAHLAYVRERDGAVTWCDDVRGRLAESLAAAVGRLTGLGCQVYVSLDADVAQAGEVPGVSAPNPAGLAATEILACARLAGASPGVSSFDVVEVNPHHDPDGRSARWAALVVWNFLAGLAARPAAAGSASSS